jgi:hypothetical protein
MQKNEKDISLENSGSNSGVIVAQHNGPMILQLQNNVKIPSHIAIIVKTLGPVCFATERGNSQPLYVFKPEDKLKYNCVIQYKEIINEYAIYYTHCDSAMNLYDNSNIGSKSRILLWVKTCYLECKGELIKSKKDDELDIDVVRNNSDLLISKVIQRVRDIIMQSIDSTYISQEDLELGIYCFICYCFMECKILEKPI